MFLRGLILTLAVAGVPGWTMLAQAPSAADNLAAGIRQIQANDFFRAQLTLNEAASQLAGQPAATEMLARIHAYRVLVLVKLDQPERARAAVALALQANPAISVDASVFSPAVVALFDAARRPATANPEAAGREAEQAGRFQDAFVSYLAALRALPEPPIPADDQRLRERIITVVARLATPPTIPAEAREHATRADRLLEAEAILGATAGASSQAAATALRQAVRTAPWWAEATFKLATVSQKLQRVDEALLNLSLYRLADPAGYAATIAKATAPAITAEPVARAVVPRPVGPATIYIYWPKQQRSSGRHKVFCNGELVAEMQNNRYVVLKAAAGTHDLAFLKKHETAVVEGGREYHFRASIEGHWKFALGEQLRPTVTDAAKAEMLDKGTSLNAAKYTRSGECGPPKS